MKQSSLIRSGNTSALFGVFFDSFAKIAISVSVLIGLIGLDSNIVYRQIMPGLCVSLFVLNIAYFLQALQMSKSLKYKVTALPCGLQASCVFVWLFAIMLPIASKTHNALLAYHVALVANFINAIIYTIFGFLLYRFKRLIPNQALIGGLAGSAFTWLTINNIGLIFNHPISGVIPLMLLLIIFIGKFRSRLSPVILGIILGSILAILTHEITPVLNLHNDGIIFPKIVNFNIVTSEVLSYVKQYLPLIVSFAIIDAISAVQIMEETSASGDTFNAYSSILISGIISGMSALLGNPFAMALFFGHASWKKMHATYNYALWVALAFLIIGSFGLASTVIAVIPDWVTLPVLIFIGISTTSLCFGMVEKKYFPIIVIAIIPILIEMLYNKLDVLATQGHINNLDKLLGGDGLQILANGSVLFSIGFSGLLVYIMERNWLMAIVYGLLMLGLSIFGFIHAHTPGWYLYAPMNVVYLSLICFCLYGYFFMKRAKN